MHEKLLHHLQPGRRLDRFELIQLLGEGAVGQVWKVRRENKQYALKLVQYQWADDEDAIAKLMREGRLLEMIKHEHIVQVHDTGVIRDARLVWIQMELLEGMTLRELMRRGPLSLALVCSYFRQAAWGTHQCHLFGAVHRDIKPENMFLTLSKQRTLSKLKLLDFGLAKFLYGQDTQDGQRQGTPLYMAPEQINCEKPTPAMDVYALGTSTYEAYAGEHPFAGGWDKRDMFVIFHRHFNLAPPPLSELGCPKEISDVVQKAMSKRPEDRFENGGAYADALGSGWLRAKQRDPALDTATGEPTLEEVLADSGRGRWFGTGPMVACPSEPFAKEGPAPHAERVHHAQTERLPQEVLRAAAKAAFVPVAHTVRLAGTTAAAPAARPEPPWAPPSEPAVESGFWPRREAAVLQPVAVEEAARTLGSGEAPPPSSLAHASASGRPSAGRAAAMPEPTPAARPSNALIPAQISNALLFLAAGLAVGLWLSRLREADRPPPPLPASHASPPGQVPAATTPHEAPGQPGPVPGASAPGLPSPLAAPAASIVPVPMPAAASVPAVAKPRPGSPRSPAKPSKRGGEVRDPWDKN
jgi:serine/threonine-protein kinase